MVQGKARCIRCSGYVACKENKILQCFVFCFPYCNVNFFTAVNINVVSTSRTFIAYINPLNAELNPICYLLALLAAHHFLHVSRIRLRLLMSYIYICVYIYIYMTLVA